MSLETLIGVNEVPGLPDGIDDPAKDKPRLQPKDLLIDAVLQQSFDKFDDRKRFDPFYLDSDNNADVATQLPGDEDLSDVFGRYTQEAMDTGNSLGAGPSEQPQQAPPSSNPFDVQGGDTGGGPVVAGGQAAGPDRAGGFNSNLDPYGEEMREALRRLVRSS